MSLWGGHRHFELLCRRSGADIPERKAGILKLLQLSPTIHKQFGRHTIPGTVSLYCLHDSLSRKPIHSKNVRCRGEQADNDKGVTGKCLPAIDGGLSSERHCNVQLDCPERGGHCGSNSRVLCQLHVHNLLHGNAAVGAVTLVVVDHSPGIANRVKALADFSQGGLHAHVGEQILVYQNQVGMEDIKTDMDNGGKPFDVLVIKERDAVQVLAFDFSFLLQP